MTGRLGILNAPVAVTQKQEHRSASIQNNDRLTPFFPAEGAAGVQKGGRDAQGKRKKNRRVERAKQLIRDYGNGERPANREASGCTLYLSEYRQLLEEISDDDALNYTFMDELRYDYTADNRGKNNTRVQQFVVRTPTAFHERIAGKLQVAIIGWKVAIEEGRAQCGTGACPGQYCTDDHTKEIAKNLEPHGSESVKNSQLAESDKKDPDLSYKLEGYDIGDDKPDNSQLDNGHSDGNLLEWPGLVVEIGWSQNSSDLRKKCEWYIENSNGEVRTVIGIDLHDLYRCYPKRKTLPLGPGKHEMNRATQDDIDKMAVATKKEKALGKAFLWHAEIDSGTKKATAVLHEDSPQIFRDENGKPVGEVAFRIRLEDFISARVLEKIGASHNPELSIMSALLCDRFESALKSQIPNDRDTEMRNKERGKGPGREK
ncbi:hypothetical protein SAMD00023353_1201630 [Rosellinia necatrix]|uniref:Uncharacterized protein n=1 Tax=Rosellinia necatrix TaxID=77044 RepID=A0A1W2TKF1_ROSNE|nr:hypothetical protein SAMD00023353_1201630 [Rosellinia necatrix]